MSVYRIFSSEAVKQELKRLHEVARSQRRVVHVVLAAKELMAKLQKDPLTFGEPSYTLKSVGLLVRHGAHFPWSVQFTVDESSKVVRIIKVALLD